MDNHHVVVSESRISCGILELCGLTADPYKVLYAIATHLYHPSRGTPAAFLLWSDIAKEGSNGESLARFIRLTLPHSSRMFESIVVENPKTSNPIRFWSYVIPHEQFKAWYIQERIERAKKL